MGDQCQAYKNRGWIYTWKSAVLQLLLLFELLWLSWFMGSDSEPAMWPMEAPTAPNGPPTWLPLLLEALEVLKLDTEPFAPAPAADPGPAAEVVVFR